MTLTNILKTLKRENINVNHGGMAIKKFFNNYKKFDEYLDNFIKLFPMFKSKSEVLSWLVTKRKINKCIICKKRIPYIHKSSSRCFCSRKCSSTKEANIIIQKRAKKSLIEKYGVENIANLQEVKDKRKNTCLKNHGVEFPLQNKEINKKAKDTCLDRYGVENVSQNKKFRKKAEKTCLKNYGVEFPSQNKEIKNKIKATYLKNYGTEHPLQNEEVKNKRKITCLEKYGVENILQNKNIREDIKNTCLEKYGVENIFQDKDIREDIKNTCLKIYGVENVFQNEEIKNKIKKTCLKKYGVEYISQHKECKDKIKNTCLEKYGVNRYTKLPQHRLYLSKLMLDKMYIKLINRLKLVNLEPLFTREEYKKCSDLYDFKCIVCETTFCGDVDDGKLPNCPKCNPQTRSKIEEELADYINELCPNVIRNDRKAISEFTKYCELDIYIPDKKIAIEFNGLYWHCDNFKEPNYHLNKTKACEDAGIKLIHIFEDEWINKKDIVKNRLKHILGYNSDKIYARKCEIRNVSPMNTINFLNDYHIQGGVKSTINYGLYYEDNLVAIMTFIKSRFNKRYDWELLRYCTLPDKSIIGGASKLLAYFRKNHIGSIISYADKRWSNGNLYKRLGFNELEDSKPSYFYFNNRERLNRMRFQKHKLKELFPNTYSDDKTESDIMLENGYHRIYDCGNKVFILL